jgi:acetyl esterase/lipase
MPNVSPAISRRWLLASGIALCSSACSQLAFFAANAPASFGDYSRQRDLTYGESPRNQLDVYLPAKPQGAPVVIFFHGGGWNSGNKDDYKFVGAALAEQGYIAVLPNYRLYPQVKFPTFMDDAAQATAWVHTHLHEWGGDAQRLYLMGHSAGAHIAVLLALNAQYLQQAGMRTTALCGVIGLSGPYDFIPFSFDYMFDLFGPPERYPASQPINYVRADAPPLWLAHGTADHTVDPGNTTRLARALLAIGAQVQSKAYTDASHSDLVAGFSRPARKRLPVLHDVVQFIQDQATSAAAERSPTAFIATT